MAQNQSGPRGVAAVVDRNIDSLLKRRRREDQARRWRDRVADGITGFTGSMPFVYIHLTVFGFWIIINLGWIPGIPRFDPSFVILAMVASVEAIFLSTFVLITQNRMAEAANKRADLDLQISLLAEHEVTRLVTLVRAIAGRMGVEEAQDPELNELARDVKPEEVLDRLDENDRNPGS
ncbi:MAG TPA: DUF1003 domain-containing protein [Verrucomicrobiae bacterium]|nr:DUF1003 domain-containing protein [Verrucomicrobiae bacterium]